MKESKLYTKKGYYNPSFFQMKIDANCDLTNLNNIAPAPFSTFIHEYIHFIQDTTSTFGLVNANIIGNRLKHYVKEVEINYGPSFPVSVPIAKDHVTQINRNLQQVYMGQGQLIPDAMNPSDVKIESVNLVETSLYLPSPLAKFLDELEVNFLFSGNSYKYKFGAIGIMETMANFIQKKHFPATSAPAIPYNSAELVAQYLYPEIGNNAEFVFALCDVCLLDYHPGRAFFRTLDLMNKKCFKPTTAEEIYEFAKTEIKGEKGESLNELFEKVSIEAESLYSEIFISPIFVNEQKWLSVLLSSARNLRLTNPTFMLNLYRQPSAKSINLANLLESLGTPLMFNRNEQAFFIPPNSLIDILIMPDRLSALLEMFRLFDDAQKNCRLSDYCSQAITIDERCKSEPWLRSTDKNLCAYAQFWRTWNLTGKSPEK